MSAKVTRPVLNMAHRGFSARHPENTLLAFSEAIKAGADAFECDIRMTRDGVLVLFHDDKLKALCGVRGRVEEMNWADLEKLKVLGKEPICRLDELIDKFPNTPINFEIKETSNYEPLVENFFSVLKKKRPLATNYLSSFSTEILVHAHQNIPPALNIKLSLIFSKIKNRSFQELKTAEWLYSWNVHLTAFKELSKKRALLPFIKPACCWTLNTRDEWTLVLDSPLELHSIITDHPDRLNQFLKERSSS